MFSFITKLLIFVLLVLLYFHIYHCFKVNKENSIHHIDFNEISKNDLDREILYKIPLYFEMKNIDIQNIENIKFNDMKNYYESSKDYEKYNMLEPNISFDVSSTLYKLDNSHNHVDIDQKLSFRNFYIVHKGPVDIYLVHPQYHANYMKNDNVTTNEKNIEFLKNSNHRIKIKLYENSVLYVPNYWLVYYEIPDIENETSQENEKDKEDNNIVQTAIIEQIHYVPLVNKLNYLYKNVISKKKEV